MVPPLAQTYWFDDGWRLLTLKHSTLLVFHTHNPFCVPESILIQSQQPR